VLDFKAMRTDVLTGLNSYLGILVIHGDQTARAPAYPYGTAKATTPAKANNGTWQQHEDGIDRLWMQSIWSFSFLAADYDESVKYASKAREWFTHTGRLWLSEHGIIVQKVTDITNRDNMLTVEYERKCGFDVVFSVCDEVQNPSDSGTGTIEKVQVSNKLVIKEE